MKLFSISATFDKKQWAGFITYIQLYHKAESVIVQIVDLLDQKGFWKTHLEEGESAEALRKRLNYDIRSQSFSNALATLGNLAEEYVGWMVWKDASQMKRSCMLQGLAKRSLSDEYLKLQKEVLREDANEKITIWDEYYKMRALFDDYYYQISTSEDNYTVLFTALLDSFKRATGSIAQVLNVEIKNRERLLSEKWEMHAGFFKYAYNENSRLKKITDHILLMNYKENSSSYEFLRKLIKSESRNQYSKYIQYIIVSYLINYIYRVIKRGNSEKFRDLLDIYDFSIKNGFFTLNDTISLQRFNNIINSASKLGKLKWARRIVDDYAHKVDKKNTKAVKNFGHATINFHQGKYEEVIAITNQIKTKNFSYRLRNRWLFLISQYEINQEYIDVVKVQVDNFRRFVNSNENRVNKTTYEGIMSSIKIINMLLLRKDIDKIKDYYRSRKYIFERRWILKKIKKPHINAGLNF